GAASGRLLGRRGFDRVGLAARGGSAQHGPGSAKQARAKRPQAADHDQRDPGREQVVPEEPPAASRHFSMTFVPGDTSAARRATSQLVNLMQPWDSVWPTRE